MSLKSGIELTQEQIGDLESWGYGDLLTAAAAASQDAAVHNGLDINSQASIEANLLEKDSNYDY